MEQNNTPEEKNCNTCKFRITQPLKGALLLAFAGVIIFIVFKPVAKTLTST